jgi:hypothetical protein
MELIITYRPPVFMGRELYLTLLYKFAFSNFNGIATVPLLEKGRLGGDDFSCKVARSTCLVIPSYASPF